MPAIDLEDNVDAMNALIVAEAAILGAHFRLPFGSANQEQALQGPDGDQVRNRLIAARTAAPRIYDSIRGSSALDRKFDSWRAGLAAGDENAMIDRSLFYTALCAGVAMYYGAGNCGENSQVALCYLATYGYPGLTLYRCHAGRNAAGEPMDHAFVLIAYPNMATIPNEDAPDWWRNPGGQYAIKGNTGPKYAGDYARDYRKASRNTVDNGYWWDPTAPMPNWIVCDPWPPSGQAVRWTEFFAGGLADGHQPILDATYQIRAEAAAHPTPGGLMGTDLIGTCFAFIDPAQINAIQAADVIDAVDADTLDQQVQGAYAQNYTTDDDDFQDYTIDTPPLALASFAPSTVPGDGRPTVGDSKWTAQLPPIIETVGAHVATLVDATQRFR